MHLRKGELSLSLAFLVACGSSTAPPKLTSISPSTGSVAGGTAVTITGTGFRSNATVSIGGAAATEVIVATAEQISAKTPAGGPGGADVVVTNSDQQKATLAQGFSFASPSITVVIPVTGSVAGGTALTITGTFFAAGAKVSIGGTAATSVIVIDSNTITATTGAHDPGSVEVRVTYADHTSAALSEGFRYVPPTSEIWVADNGAGVLVFGGSAEGNATPLRSFHPDSGWLSSDLAIDEALGEVYSSNQAPLNSITVFNIGASGAVPPKRTIGGGTSQLSHPLGLAFDGAGNVLCSNNDSGKILFFPKTATGDVAPGRSLDVDRGLTGLLFDSTAGEIFVANEAYSYVAVYDKSSTGVATPLRRIQGAATQLSAIGRPQKILVQGPELFVLGSTGLAVFARSANGNVAPRRVLSGIGRGVGLGYDLALNQLVVVDGNARTVSFYPRTASGGAASVRQITGTIAPAGVVLR